MRILVTGSRNWVSRSWVWGTLDAEAESAFKDVEHPATHLVVVHGACPSGADWWADEWAIWRMSHGVSVELERHPADWDTYGSQAGFVRNREMVDLGAHLCLAFVRNYSTGATHTRGLALAAGIPTRTFRETASGIYLGEDVNVPL